MSWLLVNKIFDEKDNKHFEGAFTQGNNYINARGTFEEDLNDATQNDIYWRLPANVTLEKPRHPKSKWGVYLPGIYGVHPILKEEMVNLPYFLGLNLYIEDERFDMISSQYSNFIRTLDMSNGALERKLTWDSRKGKIDVAFNRYLSLENKHLSVQEVTIKPLDEDIVLGFEGFIDTDVTTNGYNHFKNVELEATIRGRVYVTTDTEQQIAMSSMILIDDKKIKGSISEANGRVVEKNEVSIKKGQEVTIKKLSVICSSIDDDFYGNIKEHLLTKENEVNEDINIEKHNELWKEKWIKSDVVIDGDDKVQEVIRFSVYHLLRSVNDNGNVAIDAKGYAGEAYFGHYFWDTEVYLLPFFIYTQPNYAKKLIQYRYNTLQGAKKNAKSYGYEGARYPWESCISGEEQCSNWQYSDLEVHVTADVIYGLWHYYKATGDEEFLLNEGLEMMIETARYWISRVDRKNGSYNLMGVMGPDEYLPFTNNNSFTNYLVKFTLNKTLEVVNRTKNSEIYNRLNISENELEEIAAIANGLPILVDDEKQIIKQCENFENFLDIDFDEIWKDKSKPFGHFISQEKNYRSKALKQADVVALIYLFNDEFRNEIKKNSIEYYEKITTHDSSLSYIFHSLVYSQLGESKKAYDYFKSALDIDLGNKGCAEGIHIANCGGIWQAIIFGFAGVENIILREGIEITPKLPEDISRISFNICYMDKWRNIEINKEGCSIKEI